LAEWLTPQVPVQEVQELPVPQEVQVPQEV